MSCGNSPTYGWVYELVDGWVDGWVDGLGPVKSQKNQINLDLIKIIQFCVKIYDLWRHFHAHTNHWIQSLGIEIMSLIHSPAV